jgi:uncharacterized protein (DUF1684 family)
MTPTQQPPDSPYPDLLIYRREVTALYAELRERGSAHPDAFTRFKAARDALLAEHPQSPLDSAQRRTFEGLKYFPYNPALRFVLPLDLDVQCETFEVQLRDDGLLRLERFAKVHFALQGTPVSLSLFWVGGYGGGVFLPFRDTTNAHETYGGGRYLLDTIKGADLGEEDRGVVLDFNYAYNPSCCYNHRWECPLAPLENRLALPVRAGEKAFR